MATTGTISQLAGTRAHSLGIEGYQANMPFLRDLFHKGADHEDGDRISTVAFAKSAQERAAYWNAVHPEDPYIPLCPPIPDELVQKALLQTVAPDQDPLSWKEDVKPVTDFMKASLETYSLEVFGKALDSSSSLMHSVYDQEIISLYKRQYPLQALFGSEANRGKLAYWDAIGPGDLSNAYTGPEIPNLVESDIKTHIRSAAVKFMYSVGLVSQAVVAFGNQQYPSRDVLSIRIDAAHEALRSLRERQIMGVTRKVNGPGAFRPSWEVAGEYDYAGFSEMIDQNTTDPNYIDYSAVVAPTMGDGYFAHGDPVFAKIQVGLDQSFNQMILDNVAPSFAVCDLKTFGIVRRALFQQVRFDPVKQLAPGISKIDLVFPNCDGLALIPHFLMPMPAGNNGRIYLLSREYLIQRKVWDAAYEELAKITMAKKFVISACETFIDKSDVDGASSLHGGLFNIPIGA